MRIPAGGVRALRFFCCALLAWSIGLQTAAAAVPKPTPGQPPAQSDVRVLIDISGSMRGNDPQNLRRPALRMLSGLLQPGTRAGVWTFARWVNNLVPVADVDAAWKQRTQSLSEQIGSPGQFTNIEEVLDKASRDWSGEPLTHARHLVLLTDGMVDVSKDPRENEASRARILETLLPRLKAAAVKVHTIALSERADHELMERLAGETGGWYQQVEQAEQLQRVFLRMFEVVGRPDSVPLQDNRFVVDGSINEATVLVFSKADSPPVVLYSPSGEAYSDSDLPAGIAWYRDQGYDLITLDAPQKGEWRLQADLDPDNRVMIVTDLKLQTSEVPAHLAVGEDMRVEAYLSNRGEMVTRQAFLRLLEVHAEALTANGSQPTALNDSGEDGDEKASDGRYTMRYGAPQSLDALELVLAVDSPTFMREKRFRLAVHEPIEGTVEDGADGLTLSFAVQTVVMQPGATVSAWQETADGQRIPLDLAESGPGRWHAALSDPALPSFVQLSGTTRLGNLLDRSVGPLMAPGVEPPPALPEAPPAAAPSAGAPVAEPREQTPTAEAPAVEPAVASQPEAEQGGWFMPAMLFGGFNLLLLIAAGVWFFLRRRRGEASVELDLDELIVDQRALAESSDDAPRQEDAA